jgi:hypothetical protein
MISLSLATAATFLLCASLSCSANMSGTRCILDHAFSRCSSLHASRSAHFLIRGKGTGVPLLQVALSDEVEPVRAHGGDTAENRGSPGPTDGDVSLVPDVLEPAGRGHVLFGEVGHGGRVYGGVCMWMEGLTVR